LLASGVIVHAGCIVDRWIRRGRESGLGFVGTEAVFRGELDLVRLEIANGLRGICRALLRCIASTRLFSVVRFCSARYMRTIASCMPSPSSMVRQRSISALAAAYSACHVSACDLTTSS
jgi:hypothetical protein